MKHLNDKIGGLHLKMLAKWTILLCACFLTSRDVLVYAGVPTLQESRRNLRRGEVIKVNSIGNNSYSSFCSFSILSFAILLTHPAPYYTISCIHSGSNVNSHLSDRTVAHHHNRSGSVFNQLKGGIGSVYVTQRGIRGSRRKGRRKKGKVEKLKRLR